MKISKLIVIFCVLLTCATGMAQSLQDIQNLQVDNLSDAQIEQLVERAQSSGMNVQQLEALARERGMPTTEVTKLRERIQRLTLGSPRGQAKALPEGRQVQGMEQQYMFDSIRKSDPYYDLSPKQKKIFGYKLFHNRDLSFSPSMNIPTPQNYTVGAGDELLIDVYGASQQNYSLTVNPDGMIFIPNIGPVQLAGLSIEAATSRLRSSLNRIYSGMSGPNPNTFLQVRLGDIRSIQVNMVGELVKPGTYTLPSFASVFNAMFAAGGPNENGSFRHVQVYRDSRLVGEVDLYDFLLRGGSESNLMLKDNDVVIVPPIQTRVEIKGPVRRSGLFEVKPKESIEDLIRFAGGFSDRAYQQYISLRRSTGTEMKVDDIGQDFYESFSPQDGDVYTVGEILERYENRIQITGAVYRPGEFALTEGMTLRDLIEKAGGLRGDAFTKRATLFRTRPSLNQEVISVNIQGVMDGSIPELPLQREDVLNIASIYDIQEEHFLTISGEVNQTGIYSYAESMTVADLVLKAKGFKESATNSFIEIARRTKEDTNGEIAEIHIIEIEPNLGLQPENAAFVLRPFDHVFVRKSPGFQRERVVKVEGEVNYPGEFVISNSNERISDLLRRSGGLNQFAYPKGATLIRRTEQFKQLEEEERKVNTLNSLLERIRRDTINGISETDQELMERIEKRVDLLKNQLKKENKDEEELNSDEILRKDPITAMEDIENIELRETELVGIELVEIIENPGSKYDLILQEGDILSIPKELQTVRMRGEVLYPTTARFDKNRSFRDYISRAGGFTEQSRKGRSYVIYANGDVKQTKSFLGIKFYPDIEPGAELIVPQKPERDPLSAQAWVSIGSGLATIALVISQIF